MGLWLPSPALTASGAPSVSAEQVLGAGRCTTRLPAQSHLTLIMAETQGAIPWPLHEEGTEMWKVQRAMHGHMYGGKDLDGVQRKHDSLSWCGSG